MSTTLTTEVDGAVGRLTLDRPESLNPLSFAGLEELIAAARAFDEQTAVKVVVVQGRGRAFSAGMDLSSFSGTPDRDPRDGADLGRAMVEAIEAMRAVTIASVHGHCIGGGLLLALACDLRIAAASTRFAIPEVDLGVPLTWGGIPRLVREIGPAATRDLVLTCRSFGADEALRLGILTRVVDDDALGDSVEDLARALADKSSLTLHATLAAVDAAAEAMVATSASWADADAMVSALRDPESRDVARRYLRARGR